MTRLARVGRAVRTRSLELFAAACIGSIALGILLSPLPWLAPVWLGAAGLAAIRWGATD